MKHRVVTTGTGRTQVRLSNAVMTACQVHGVDMTTAQMVVRYVVSQLEQEGLVLTKQVTA